MRYRYYTVLLITVTIILILTAGQGSSELHQTGKQYILNYYVICPGGYMPVMSNQHMMWGTFGEPVSGTSMNSSYILGAGVWNTWTSSPPPVIADDENTGPASITIYQNNPNPFNPATTITYEIPSLSRISIRIYNIHGQVIRTLYENSPVDAGSHRIVWNGRDSRDMPVSSGVYLYRMTVRPFDYSGEVYSTARKMILMK